MNLRRTMIKLLLLFVLPCSLITGYLYFSIGNIQSLKLGPIQLLDNQYTLRAMFDDVTGMLPNDNVKVAGVVVGKVTKVKVIDGRAQVTFKVRDGVKLADRHQRGDPLAQLARAALSVPVSGFGGHHLAGRGAGHHHPVGRRPGRAVQPAWDPS